MSAKNGRIHNKRHLVEVDTVTAYLAVLESCLSCGNRVEYKDNSGRKDG